MVSRTERDRNRGEEKRREEASLDAQTIVKVFIPLALGVIMFGMGLGLTPADFRRVLEEPRAATLGLLSQLLLLPLLGFLCAWGLGLSGPMAVGLVLITACPGGPTSNFFSALSGGDVALSVTLTALSGVVTVLTIPLVVNLATSTFMGSGSGMELPILRTMAQILGAALAPVLLAMWVRARWPERATAWEGILRRVSVGLLAILIVGAVAKEAGRVASYFGEVGGAVITMNLTAMLLGVGLARAGRLPREQAKTIALEVGMQNAALAIGIALGVMSRTDVAIPAVIYGLWMYFPCLAIVWWSKRGGEAA